MNFGAKLRVAREAAGMSQFELSMKTGIQNTRISAYENGHVEPNLSSAAKLALALKVSLDCLAGLSTPAA